MKLKEIAQIVEGKILTKTVDLEREVFTACGSDMMSDVLAFVKHQSVLLTGLNNPQAIRTAQMMDMLCVVFVRGKVPSEQIIEMGEQNNIAIISTDKTMFVACGLLYMNGLKEETL